MYPDTKNITGNDLPEVRQGAARQLLPRIGLTRSGTYRVKWSDGTIDVFVVSAAGSPAVLQYTEQQGDGQAGSNC
ncbi:hypothetical protein HNQ51_000453 [Inhella inkyongensis]|uniref:Uncharacterized protein n=1 Tax=Inhella inkyongensis TaxID=392593 RepID=A0A840S3M7_9BURK|nr:hypothetical protein [Inhella inkyongensis]MBB5203160.1 hypothetical protein [Inhella inkyongensis]